MMKDFLFQGIFRVGVCALHTLGRHVDWKVQSHGLIKRLGKRMLKLRKKMLGSWVSPTLGAMLWMNQKLGAMLWMSLDNFRSDFVRNIHLRLYSGPFGCRVPSYTKSVIVDVFKVFQSNDTRVWFHLSPFTCPFIGI
jgi:hypothetical protein